MQWSVEFDGENRCVANVNHYIRDSASADVRPTLKTCPITASMGVLGKKWTLLLMRDLLVYELDRFNQFQRSSGLSPRVLSKRLEEMQAEGLIEKHGDGLGTRYSVTAKGRAIAPILDAVIDYGILHHASEVFLDGQPMTSRSFRRKMEAHGVRFWSDQIAPHSTST